jgi:hypothetical protein
MARDKSIHIFEIIRSYFPHLSTLPTSPPNVLELRLNALESSKIITELKLVDLYFRGISSLPELIIEVHEGDLSDDVRRGINVRGWKSVIDIRN